MHAEFRIVKEQAVSRNTDAGRVFFLPAERNFSTNVQYPQTRNWAMRRKPDDVFEPA
jgi:hypothetical protein